MGKFYTCACGHTEELDGRSDDVRCPGCQAIGRWTGDMRDCTYCGELFDIEALFVSRKGLMCKDCVKSFYDPIAEREEAARCAPVFSKREDEE